MMPEETIKLLHAFSALADLGEEIADTHDFEEMVRTSLHVVLGALGVRRGMVAEYARDASELRPVAARGMGDAALLTSWPLPAKRAEGLRECGASAVSLLEQSSGDEVEHRLGAPWLTTLRQMRIELFVPLLVRHDLVGAILLGGKASEKPFTAEERDVVRTMARHIGVGMHRHRLLREVERRAEENLHLYDELRGLYRDTVRAFAAAIDCKDKYTQGHSERVGKYSEIIAREMGWSEEQIEGIAIAGYLHDIGKLVVERDIINAPYKIDAKQSTELNRHPAAGFEILAPIHHPYADIPLMAKYHHERIDGRGYPEGLTGEQIPPGAKIVALADSFDAMTTDRPYKRRCMMEEVIEDLRRNANKQFAPEVIVALCRALLREVDGEAKERKIVKLLGKDYIDAARIRPLLARLIAELEAGACFSASGD